MKAQNLKLYLILSCFLIYQINLLATVVQEIIHKDSEYAKVAVLEDKGVWVLSKLRGENKFMESKLDKKGNFVYSNFCINQGYSATAQLVQPLSANGFYPQYFLFYHNMQNLRDQVPHEMELKLQEIIQSY